MGSLEKSIGQRDYFNVMETIAYQKQKFRRQKPDGDTIKGYLISSSAGKRAGTL
jgi:hypothetical protein